MSLRLRDRSAIGAMLFMYAAIPLFGTFAVLDPVRPNIPAVLSTRAVSILGAAMLIAGLLCIVGAVQRRVARLTIAMQLAPGLAIYPGALLGFDPITGLLLAVFVTIMGCVGICLEAYADEPGVVRATTVTLVLASALASAAALAMVLLRRPAAVFAYNNGRAVGVLLNANELAAYELLALGACAALAFGSHSRWLRAIGIATTALDLAALGATYSRWGFLAAIVGALVFAALTRRPAALAGCAAIAVTLAIVAFGPGAAHHNPRDDASRAVAWQTGWQTYVHFPLTGVGPLAYGRTYEFFRPPEGPAASTPVAFDPHSVPLAVLAESGLPGIFSLLFVLIAGTRAVVQAVRARGVDAAIGGIAVLAAIVAFEFHVLINTISFVFTFATQGFALAHVLARRGLDDPAV